MHFLLVTHFSPEEVREHLEEYFRRSQQIVEDDHSLCLLCIQCLEVQIIHIKSFSHLVSINIQL